MLNYGLLIGQMVKIIIHDSWKDSIISNFSSNVNSLKMFSAATNGTSAYEIQSTPKSLVKQSYINWFQRVPNFLTSN